MNAALRVVSAPTPDPVEAEFDKDVWDVRNIPGAQYHPSSSHYKLNFTGIPSMFSGAVKRFIRFQITHTSRGACANKIYALRRFLQFYHRLYPESQNLNDLSRADIEKYLSNLRGMTMDNGQPLSQNVFWQSVQDPRHFLEYLQRIDHPCQSTRAAAQLIWPSDNGRQPQKYRDTVKYIPERVLEQLELYMEKLPPHIIPIIILLRATGFRISDVLTLRHNTCLERTSSGWWICGDISKTKVMNHRVPISEEVAIIVEAQRALVQEKFTDADNPHRYLFPALTQKRKGLPLGYRVVSDTLNRLAVACNITDEKGNVFRFRTHGFRHTIAVEMINNGMSLVNVQKWLAHCSPEMTLHYAKIKDSTVRKEWEKAFAKGAVRLDTTGIPALVDTTQLVEGENVEWEHIRHNLNAVRLPNGYCFKPKHGEGCPTQAIPCHTCHNFCTTSDFLPQFLEQRRGVLELIELGEKAGNAQWVERNRENLDKIEPIIDLLETGKLHHPAGKGVREYTPKEREKRQQDGK